MKTPALIIVLLVALVPSMARTQALSQAFVQPTWQTFIFVSTTIPRSTLSELARQAAHAKATLVLNGFEPNARTLEATREFITRLNEECCARNPSSWVIHPKLFEAFNVQKTPAFVLAEGQTASKGTFVSVTGEMSLPNAYKFFAQNAGTDRLQKKAADIYTKTYRE